MGTMREDSPNFILPARYAFRAAMKTMEEIWNEKNPDYWIKAVKDMVARGAISAEETERIISGIDPRIMLSVKRAEHRRMGKVETTFDFMRMQPQSLIPRDAAEGVRARQIIVLRRDVVTLKQKEIVATTGKVGVAMDRHAAERLYERGSCTQHQIFDRMKDGFRDMVRHMAFARAAGIIKTPREGGALMLPGNATLLPLDEGMMCMEALCVDTSGLVARRALVRRGGTTYTSAQHRPETIFEAEPLDGRPAQGLSLMTGITYISGDLLRLDQLDYLALFEDAMKGVPLDDLVEMMGRVALPHERHADWPIPPSPNEKMMRLLRENVKRNKDAIRWRLAPKPDNEPGSP